MAVHFEDDAVRIHKTVASPYDNNAYIIVCKVTNKALIVDTPRDAGVVLGEAQYTDVVSVVITHGHKDHIEGYTDFKAELRVPIGLHSSDADRLLPHVPDFNLKDADTIRVGELPLKLMHTPGHTPGGVCLLLGKHLFSGDTLFPGGPGKTPTPKALKQVLMSITGTLFELPDDTHVYPGHGADTTIGAARAEYEVFAAHQHPADLCGDVLWRG